MHRIAAAAWWLVPWVLLLPAILALRVAAQGSGHAPEGKDWPQFGLDVSSSGALDGPSGITAANVASLVRRQVQLDGTVDASPIYLHGVAVNGSARDAFFVTTSYGKTIAIDAASGAVLWEYTPSGYASWAGTGQITNSTPAADPDRQNLYAAAPDGTVEKLAIADGSVVWKTAITLLPDHEKIASPLKVFRGRVVAVTGGFLDTPPFQGHVAVLDARTGALQHVWNSLCSDRTGLLDPASCPSSLSSIWGRAGAVIDPATGNIFVATGNGPYNGRTNWGDSVIELNPDATEVLANYTPADNSALEGENLDLGSASPVLLGANALAQGGKDTLIRLLRIADISGGAPHSGNELQTIAMPTYNGLIQAAAVWRDRGSTWMFTANNGNTAGWVLGNGQLTLAWSNATAGTSPVIAGRLLYVYNPDGGLFVYDPHTGARVATLPCGAGHWNSPIVIDGRIALPEGNANQHATSGVLDIWTLPAADPGVQF